MDFIVAFFLFVCLDLPPPTLAARTHEFRILVPCLCLMLKSFRPDMDFIFCFLLFFFAYFFLFTFPDVFSRTNFM